MTGDNFLSTFNEGPYMYRTYVGVWKFCTNKYHIVVFVFATWLPFVFTTWFRFCVSCRFYALCFVVTYWPFLMITKLLNFVLCFLSSLLVSFNPLSFLLFHGRYSIQCRLFDLPSFFSPLSVLHFLFPVLYCVFSSWI